MCRVFRLICWLLTMKVWNQSARVQRAGSSDHVINVGDMRRETSEWNCTCVSNSCLYVYLELQRSVWVGRVCQCVSHFIVRWCCDCCHHQPLPHADVWRFLRSFTRWDLLTKVLAVKFGRTGNAEMLMVSREAAERCHLLSVNVIAPTRPTVMCLCPVSSSPPTVERQMLPWVWSCDMLYFVTSCSFDQTCILTSVWLKLKFPHHAWTEPPD